MKLWGCEKMIFIFFTALFIRDHAGSFPVELLTALHFLSFPGKQEKEAARAWQLAVSNEQLAVGGAFFYLVFEAFVVLTV